MCDCLMMVNYKFSKEYSIGGFRITSFLISRSGDADDRRSIYVSIRCK